MSADRELLTLAAKALGYPVHTDDRIPRGHNVFYLNGKPWTPLTDDGDALRLAVDLKLIKNTHQWLDEAVGHAATRRAIVRAAAEIGRGMP